MSLKNQSDADITFLRNIGVTLLGLTCATGAISLGGGFIDGDTNGLATSLSKPPFIERIGDARSSKHKVAALRLSEFTE